MNDAVRRVRRRCETWDVPIDLRNAALAQYRESSNLILAHFEKLHDLSRVLDVHCGRSHSLVLTHAGEVWSLGMFFASVGVRNMKRFYQSHTHWFSLIAFKLLQVCFTFRVVLWVPIVWVMLDRHSKRREVS